MGGNFFARLFDRISLDRQLDQANAECMQKGIIFGVHLSYCEAGLITGEDQEAIEISRMVEQASQNPSIAHLRRYAQFLRQHYFIGESKPELSCRLQALEPEKILKDFGVITGRTNVAVFPHVHVYDPAKIGLVDDVPRIEALLADAGIHNMYVDGKVRLFLS